MAEKVKFGLKNVHYAVVTETEVDNEKVIEYGTPVRIPGAVNLTMSAAGDKVEFDADDGTYFEQNSNNGYEGSLEIALVPESFEIDILGFKEDANGAIIENSDAISKNFALMFEFTTDKAARRYVNYNCNASRPNVDGTTKGKSIEVKTESFDFTAKPALDSHNVKAKLTSDKEGYDTFYDSVYIEEPVTP